MSFRTLEAALNGAVYDHLSDDPAAQWSRAGVVICELPVIVTIEERAGREHAMAILEEIDVVRFPMAAAAIAAPGQAPQAGDVIRANGRTHVVHGQPWKDGINGPDWVCPISEAG